MISLIDADQTLDSRIVMSRVGSLRKARFMSRFCHFPSPRRCFLMRPIGSAALNGNAAPDPTEPGQCSADCQSSYGGNSFLM